MMDSLHDKSSVRLLNSLINAIAEVPKKAVIFRHITKSIAEALKEHRSLFLEFVDKNPEPNFQREQIQRSSKFVELLLCLFEMRNTLVSLSTSHVYTHVFSGHYHMYRLYLVVENFNYIVAKDVFPRGMVRRLLDFSFPEAFRRVKKYFSDDKDK